ncbi:DUF4440 domain-containing protein [Roseateles sp.]|uniref:nuclear transport factor 2 family protein n=1 Tax=Roseateles sp. TaxID=1971397 RepID=UPI0032633B90
MIGLLSELRRLEIGLHHPGVRLDEARLRALLHADFREVGRSGRAYDLATVLRFLAEQGASAEGPPDVVHDRFTVRALGPASALLTYRSAHRLPDGTLTRHTLRSSVWLREAESWQLFYHQGTPAEVAW